MTLRFDETLLADPDQAAAQVERIYRRRAADLRNVRRTSR